MKREKRFHGFTLVELLISIAVIVILMSMVFRLANIGGDTQKRNDTIRRLEALENCLSAYYAAFGCYPPVPLQGVSRNIMTSVDGLGRQGGSYAKPSQSSEDDFWDQVDAAARAQPVAMYFPTAIDDDSLIADLSAAAGRMGGGSHNLSFTSINKLNILGGNVNNPNSKYDGEPLFKTPLWTDVQIFRYGLMAYLLPRYRFMMYGKKELYTKSVQWTAFNSVPSYPDTGQEFGTWEKFLNELFNNSSVQINKDWIIDNLPSQTVCRRWLPNLKEMVNGSLPDDATFYGVKIVAPGNKSALGAMSGCNSNDTAFDAIKNTLFEYSGRQYILDAITVADGWGRDFYYYSPPPHQTYWLWSAGPDGRTCPPWVKTDANGLSADQRKWLIKWSADDIMGLSN